MKAREGDLIENRDQAIFDVKGLIHPPHQVIAFVRYFPDPRGARTRNSLKYGKVYSLSERHRLLKKKWPTYVVNDPILDETICEVPINEVKAHDKPAEKLCSLRHAKTLDHLQSKALLLATSLKEHSNLPWNAIGISGSILADLHTRESDIDLTVYGSANCRKVYSTLKGMLKDPSSLFRPYDSKALRKLFSFRSKDTAMTFEDFVRTESKKVLQGKFVKTDYFVRFVKDWNEIDEKYGDIQYKNVGYARIKATVIDDAEAIFTPCAYRVANVTPVEGPRHKTVKEIVSFRGRFCEQAKAGEDVIAQGKIERVTDTRDGSEYFRLLVGNNYEDFIVPRPSRLFRSK
jgi:hypothetical protein